MRMAIRVFWRSSTPSAVFLAPSSSRYSSNAQDWVPSSIFIKRWAVGGCRDGGCLASSSGPIIELGVVTEDAFLIERQTPLGRKIRRQPAARRCSVVERDDS